MDCWGAWDRQTGLCVLTEYSKLGANGQRRMGAASIAEVIPLIDKHIIKGTHIISDKLLAYQRRLSRMGYVHDSVCHSRGEYVRKSNTKIHTNSIEGAWGRLKNKMRGMQGVQGASHRLILADQMWRHNTRVLAKCVFVEALKLYTQ